MIATWMLTVLVFTALLGAAAWCAEMSLRASRQPTRWVWLAASAVALGWPIIVSITRQVLPPPVVAGSAQGFILPVVVATYPAAIATASAVPLDGILIALWLVMSGVMIIRVVRASTMLARAQRSSKPQVVDGVEVLVSESLGPAVVGVLRPRVLFPQSLLELDEPLRRLVLRHEEEHRLARDPWLVVAAAGALVLMPWNVPLWWVTRRMRLALEMDCDARVIARNANAALYGKLLLLISQSPGRPVIAPMLAVHNSHLERRIAAMLPTRSNRSIRIAAGALGAIVAVMAACTSRIADITSPSPAVTANSATGTSSSPVYFEFQVDKQVRQVPGSGAPRYPAMLRSANVEGVVLAQFVVDENGKYEPQSLKILKSDHELFTESAVEALPTIAFAPAELKGKRVKQLVQQPFTYSLDQGVSVMRAAAMAVVEHRIRPENAPTSAGAALIAGERRFQVTEVPAQRAGAPYFEFQVSKRATQIPGSRSLRYPTELRNANVEGEVLAQFIVDETGLVEPGSFKVLKSSDERFNSTVSAYMPAMRFTPAEVSGKTVRQIIQQPFTFKLSKE